MAPKRRDPMVITLGGLIVLVVAGIIALVVYLYVNSSEFTQTHGKNTPVGPYATPPNSVIELPYNWNNVVRVCQNGEGIYEAFHGTAIYVVPADPNCK